MKREQLEQILLDVQKPAQYIGGELNSIMKDKEKVDCRLAFCFPDKYEVGMSHLGMKILYSLYNERENWWCERVFAPDADMEQLMREKNIPLYGLESLDPIRDFDFILFTMQYEMSYTAILNMLDLAGVPVRSKDRTALAPMVVAGGPCACNPEPVADFIDIFIIGEGEEVNIELTDLYMQAKKEGWDKQRFLQQAAQNRRRVCSKPVRRQLPRGRHHRLGEAQLPAGAGKGDQTNHCRFGQGILSKTVCCTVHQHRSRPLDAGDSARLSARLPLLSGGLYLSSAARQAL